jgi:hypothetical protein
MFRRGFAPLSATSHPVYPYFAAYPLCFTCFADENGGKTPNLRPVMQASGQTSPVAVFGPGILRLAENSF